MHNIDFVNTIARSGLPNYDRHGVLANAFATVEQNTDNRNRQIGQPNMEFYVFGNYQNEHFNVGRTLALNRFGSNDFVNKCAKVTHNGVKIMNVSSFGFVD